MPIQRLQSIGVRLVFPALPASNRDHTRFNRVWCSGNIADSHGSLDLEMSQQPGVRLPVSELQQAQCVCIFFFLLLGNIFNSLEFVAGIYYDRFGSPVSKYPSRRENFVLLWTDAATQVQLRAPFCSIDTDTLRPLLPEPEMAVIYPDSRSPG
jgi:hypothetical protein